MISYSYTIARQDRNERKVNIDTFLKIYYNSIKYTFEVIGKFSNIQFEVASKSKNREWKQLAFRKKDRFDKYFRVEYNEDTLREKLSTLNGNTILNIIGKIGLIKN